MEYVFLPTFTVLLHYFVGLPASQAIDFGQFARGTRNHLTNSLEFVVERGALPFAHLFLICSIVYRAVDGLERHLLPLRRQPAMLQLLP